MLTCLIKIWDNMAYIDSIPPFNSYNVSHCNLVMVVVLNKIDWIWNGVGVGFETPELELELELKPPELELELELIFWRLAGVGVGVETSGVGVGVDIMELTPTLAWSSIEEVPYCFPRSSVKFQGRMALKIVEFDPNWPFPDCNSSLKSPMATKWCTKLEVALKRCPIVFQGDTSNCKVTWL